LNIKQFKQIEDIQSFTNKLIGICQERLKILLKEREHASESVIPEINRRIELRQELIQGFNKISKERIREIFN